MMSYMIPHPNCTLSTLKRFLNSQVKLLGELGGFAAVPPLRVQIGIGGQSSLASAFLCLSSAFYQISPVTDSVSFLLGRVKSGSNDAT